jgi:hypothetical protein
VFEGDFTRDGFRTRSKATVIIPGLSTLAFSTRTALRSRRRKIVRGIFASLG